ncbi:hypothetical protein BVX98_07395 [bacterium F11]|nr:hypothetical protein BVX98_07395 [bacterium F11]
MKKLIGFSIGTILAFCLSIGLTVAEDMADYDYEDYGYSSYGSVKKIDLIKNNITLTEYDEEKEKVIDVAYNIDPIVELANIGSLEELKIGDAISLEYIVRENMKTVTILELNSTDAEANDKEESKGYYYE